jgi:hypothetical protein
MLSEFVPFWFQTVLAILFVDIDSSTRVQAGAGQHPAMCRVQMRWLASVRDAQFSDYERSTSGQQRRKITTLIPLSGRELLRLFLEFIYNR